MSNKTKLSTIMREKRIRNAPALIAAAELGMAWREQAEAAREWINHPDHFNTDEGATDGQAHVAYINACKRTDQLTGRIGR